MRDLGLACSFPYLWILRSAVSLVPYDTGQLEPDGFTLFVALRNENVGQRLTALIPPGLQTRRSTWKHQSTKLNVKPYENG